MEEIEDLIQQATISKKGRNKLINSLILSHFSYLVKAKKKHHRKGVNMSEKNIILNSLGLINLEFKYVVNNNIVQNKIDETWDPEELIRFLNYHVFYDEFVIKLKDKKNLPDGDKVASSFAMESHLELPYNLTFIKRIEFRKGELENIYRWYIHGQKDYKGLSFDEHYPTSKAELERHEWRGLNMGDSLLIEEYARMALNYNLITIALQLKNAKFEYASTIKTYLRWRTLNYVTKELKIKLDRRDKKKEKELEVEERERYGEFYEEIKLMQSLENKPRMEYRSEVPEVLRKYVIKKLEDEFDLEYLDLIIRECLTEREQAVLAMWKEGYNYKEIMHKLNFTDKDTRDPISLAAYRNYQRHALRKLREKLGVINEEKKNGDDNNDLSGGSSNLGNNDNPANEDGLDEAMDKYLSDEMNSSERETFEQRLEEDQGFLKLFLEFQRDWDIIWHIQHEETMSRAHRFLMDINSLTVEEKEELEFRLKYNKPFKEIYELQLGKEILTDKKEFSETSYTVHIKPVINQIQITQNEILELYQLISSQLSSFFDVYVILRGVKAGQGQELSDKIEISFSSEKINDVANAISLTIKKYENENLVLQIDTSNRLSIEIDMTSEITEIKECLTN